MKVGKAWGGVRESLNQRDQESRERERKRVRGLEKKAFCKKVPVEE